MLVAVPEQPLTAADPRGGGPHVVQSLLPLAVGYGRRLGKVMVTG